jgi:hypothetical protein
VALATTWRLATAAGGAATRLAVAARAPKTLCCVGVTATLALTGADAICWAFTATEARFTGCELAKACRGTAVTAPLAFRLA